jgi:hypothetical protein
MELFEVAPIGFEQALRHALAAEGDVAAGPDPDTLVVT